jgi:ribosome-associated heat shock protein Hsp15
MRRLPTLTIGSPCSHEPGSRRTHLLVPPGNALLSRPMGTLSEQTRIDRWLTAARIFKSRTLAQAACDAGHVRINDQQVRASHQVKIGDEVRALAPRGTVILQVKGLADKRLSAALAQLLFEDHSPPPPPKEERVAVRERGAGRPTKADRRAISRLRGR